MMSKKILITGGCGFIGTNLVRHLLEETEHTILNVDKLTYAGDTGSLNQYAGHQNYHFEKVDLIDKNQVAKVVSNFGPDWIVNLAAESHVDRSIKNAECFVQSNVVGTYHLLEACLLYTSPSPRDATLSRMPSSA